jgi:acetyltransferase-like isoleucine patch superfamily enzyme
MGTIIYGDVVLGDYFQTGHNTIIRAKVRAGNYCTVYNQSTLEGIIRLGDGVRIMSHVYIPSRTWIGSHVFIGPGCTFLNEKKPCRYDTPPTPVGATIEDDVMIGGGCTIMAGVKIGEGSFIAAGAVVIEDIPPWSLAKGVPAKIGPLPEHLRRRNCRALTIQPLDFWHPKSPGSALPTWPASWKIETP